MDKSRPRYRKIERREEFRKDLIIKTKVSVVRRVIEIIISLFFWGVVVFLLSYSIDSFIFRKRGFHLLYTNIPELVAEIGYLTALIFIVLEISLFLLAFLWISLNRGLYKYKRKQNENLTEPLNVNKKEISSYFQLSLEEVNHRQGEDELIIYENENIDNTYMKILRAQYHKDN